MNRWWRALLSLIVGVAVLLWSFPYYGLDSDPPHHFNVFDQEIPNDSQLVALAAALAAGLLVWLITPLRSRPRKDEVGSDG